MAPLAVRPGRNAFREARRLKEIRKVKTAIAWHTRERAKRQKLAELRHESRQAVMQRIMWENENVKHVRKLALLRAKEDWELGPLRPNRAVGENAATYGALAGQQVQTPAIPTHTQKQRNETRAKRGMELEYPLVVDDKKYFHLAPGDRVVVIRGREKGKIGLVQSILPDKHEVIVKGINEHYYDSSVLANPDPAEPKRKNEVPLPLDDVRLVIPYQINEQRRIQRGQLVDVSNYYYTDVIVDKIVLERHTTGIDPFTGKDYGHSELPKDHQYDPQTNLPIFHRYIAGTRQRIEWPWEQEEPVADLGRTRGKRDGQKKTRGFIRTMLHPIKGLRRLKRRLRGTAKPTSVAAVQKREEDMSGKVAKLEQQVAQARRTYPPKSHDPKFHEAFDTDTTRNLVEGADNMRYTLLDAPYPPTLGNELRGNISAFKLEARKKAKDAGETAAKETKYRSEDSAVQREIAKTKSAAAQRMKTPMQLRWELERARKIKEGRTAPRVSTEELVRKLREYQSGVKSAKVEELD
ncbi:hypothetical protein ACEQ8H_001914 [Pleosporales sp. CAS-2024a]